MIKVTSTLSGLLSRARQSPMHIKIGWAIVMGGVLIRVYLYFFNPIKINTDETVAYLLYDQYGAWEMFFPPRRGYIGCIQYPFLFLVVSKYLVVLFGNHMYVLRLVPFISGILALVLFNKIKDVYLPRWPGLMALFLMAINWRFIFYGMRAKPYATELFVTVFLLFIIHKMRVCKDITKNKFMLFSAAGVLSVWASNPGIFILTAGMTALGLNELGNLKKGRFNKRLFFIFLLWGLNFIINYWTRLRIHTLEDSYLVQGWGPLNFYNRGLWSSVTLACGQLGEMFEFLFSVPALLVLAFLIMGAVWFYRYRRFDAAVLILAFFLTVVAAMLNKYLLYRRLLLFLLPVFCILIAAGGRAFYKLARFKIERFIILILCGYMMVAPLEHIIKPVFNRPSSQEGIIAKLEYAWEHFKEGDILYITPRLHYEFHYVNKAHRIPDKSFMFAKAAKYSPEVFKDMERLKKSKRIWFFYKKSQKIYSDYLKERLDEIGVIEEEWQGNKYSFCLYKLSPTENEGRGAFKP